MNAKEQIGRLQNLLERVQARALEARGVGGALAPSARSPQTTPMPEHAEVEYESLPPQMVDASTPAPGVAAYFPPDDDDADVEVSSETVEIDIDIDEPMLMESGAQPVVQQTMPPAELEEVFEDQSMATQAMPVQQLPVPSTATQPMATLSSHPPAYEEEVGQIAPANEIEEPTPSSSRRPIAAEAAAETYGDESAPRHTPPPESGKQVAAPSVHPAANRAPSSAPPPSLEGHTLVGGWREPGLGAPQVTHSTSPGVRPPTPLSVQPAAAAQAQGAPAPTSAISPDVMRPELPGSANVASFQGPAAVARPTTLGELLDMTLSL